MVTRVGSFKAQAQVHRQEERKAQPRREPAVQKRFGDELSSGRGGALRARAAKLLGGDRAGRFDDLVGLKKGDTGEKVERLQDRLGELVPMSDAERTRLADGRGSFGDLTKDLVKRFQLSQGLPQTGEIDAQTAARLDAPLPPEQVARNVEAQTRERVRAQAEAQVMACVSPQEFHHLPPEDQAALRAEARKAGDAAVARFDRDLRTLVDQELEQAGLSRADLRNLPPEDRAAALAGPTLNALARVNAQLDALDVSAAQMKDTGTLVNRNNGQSVSSDPKAWNNYCLAFVATCFGRNAPDLSSTSAINAANAAAANGTLQTDRDYQRWPPGTVVFFEATDANGQDGHVAIFTGKYTEDGEPIIRTTGWKNHDGITEMTLSELERISGPYLGNIPYPDVN